MPQVIIYLDEELNEMIESFCKKSKCSKNDAVIKILKEYNEEIYEGD